MVKDLFEYRWLRRTCIIAIPAVIFILVSAGIRVSTYGIDHTILVLGQRELVAGWPAALRISLISDDGQHYLPTRIGGFLVRGAKRLKLFDDPVADRGYATAHNFRVPQMAPGGAELELDVRFEDRRRTVRASVRIVDEPPVERLVVPSDSAEKGPQGEVVLNGNRFQIFTEDRGAPTGLPSLLFLRSQTTDGNPVATQMRVQLPGGSDGGAGEVVETDRSGLYAMLAKPRDLSFPVRLSGAERSVEEGSAYLRPKVIYAAIAVLVQNPIVPSGERLRLRAHQISDGGPVYADVFVKGRWVWAQSAWFGGKKAELQIEAPLHGMARVQITTSPFMPGPAVAVRHFFKLSKDQNVSDGLQRILEELSRSSESDRRWAQELVAMERERQGSFDRIRAAAFALARRYGGHQKIPTLVSSRQADDRELSAFKQRFQRSIMVAIIALGIGLALLIALTAVQSRRRQHRLTEMILHQEMGDAADPRVAEKGFRGDRAERWQTLFQGLVVFFIIVGAFTAIAVLVDTMTWIR